MTRSVSTHNLIDFFKRFYKFFLAFIITICSIRFYEYYCIASKSFINNTYAFELLGFVYDIWMCLIYSLLLLPIYYILTLISNKIAAFTIHIFNALIIVIYISLIIVFSERNNPFDHEFFTRKAFDTWTTTKQMMTSGLFVYVPFILFVALYFVLYYKFFKQVSLKNKILISFVCCSILATIFFQFANPPQKWFKQTGAYYLACNKLTYWVNDSYNFITSKDKYDASKLNNKQVAAAIDFYQANHPFQFTSKEYPLLHNASDQDVLGNFFNLNETPPNIVILVGEGLSRDFSGDNAYASSFTPFLDSLSQHSLTWDNFLSTAPATFAAHPAIEGSLPYGKRGFSAMNIMPDHLTLIKILKANGYHSNFMIGFNPDFDNMGGFIRLQGTDMILSKYGSKYKEMGIGSEGWSMGYPDDALFSRSFEVMDSLKQSPYLNIYHTGTTHMPYLFEQKPLYEKLFDKKMKTINVSSSIKKTLKECKKVLVTYMFADDCYRTFFKQYSKRPEYDNTIFIITGDHHIGSFPSTGSIDDYHVPLVIYSPMLKAPKKFLSVNSHNNLAPTITSLILNNYKQLPYQPKEVHWLADVLDTCTTFRNQQSMSFMAWSREIEDYIYKHYILSNGELYKLTPTLLMDKVDNDSMKQHITNLLNNFKIINSYVCDNNKIFPANKMMSTGEKKLLLDYIDSKDKLIYHNNSDTSIMPYFKVPTSYKYLYVEITAETNLLSPGTEDQPAFTMALIDADGKNWNYLYSSNRDITLMSKGDYLEKQFNAVSTNDMFALDEFKASKNIIFDLTFYTEKPPINLRLKNLHVKIYGVK